MKPRQVFFSHVDAFPDDFKVNAGCTMELHMKLMPTEDELLLSNNGLRISASN